MTGPPTRALMTTRPRQAPRCARTLQAPPPKTTRQCPPPRGEHAQRWRQGTRTADVSDNVAHQGARRRPLPRGARTRRRQPNAWASTRRRLTPRAMTSRGGAREASHIPSCKGGASAAPWGARKASPIPSCEGGASGIIFLSIIVTMLIKIQAQRIIFFEARRALQNKQKKAIVTTC